ncbi:MAG TPA: reverse transcriptase-like protein [Gemmatimonadales bacterium]|nr:reverse transcriptase-like protein [Gemmatimonadales bacterium]
MTAARELHAHVAEVEGGISAAIGIVFVDARGWVLRCVGRLAPGTARDHAAFQGILLALWDSRRLGCRRVVAQSDHPGVVAQINGHREVHLELIGPYLEVRSLLHAYQSARVEMDQSPWKPGAVAVARAALASGPTDQTVDELPLWACACRDNARRPLTAPPPPRCLEDDGAAAGGARGFRPYGQRKARPGRR